MYLYLFFWTCNLIKKYYKYILKAPPRSFFEIFSNIFCIYCNLVMSSQAIFEIVLPKLNRYAYNE